MFQISAAPLGGLNCFIFLRRPPYLLLVFFDLVMLISLFLSVSLPPSPPPFPSPPDPFASHTDFHTPLKQTSLGFKGQLPVHFVMQSLHPTKKSDLDAFLQDQITLKKKFLGKQEKWAVTYSLPCGREWRVMLMSQHQQSLCFEGWT